MLEMVRKPVRNMRSENAQNQKSDFQNGQIQVITSGRNVRGKSTESFVETRIPQSEERFGNLFLSILTKCIIL